MPYGTSTLSVEQKARAGVRFEYDERGLAALVIGDATTPLSLSMTLNASELEILLSQGAKVLDHMMATNAIGVDTLNQRNHAAIRRLEHVTGDQPKQRMSSAEKAEQRRQAIAEIRKVREAKQRGDYA